LFGERKRADQPEVRLLFTDQQEPGYTTLNTKTGIWTLHLNSTEARTPAALDYRAVVIHELTHVVQNHAPVPRPWVWLSEGIADYVTYTHFTKNNDPALRLDKQGYLVGYTEALQYLHGLQRKRIRPDDEHRLRGVKAGKGYQHGYTVTAAFLLWLESRKDRDIVQKLSIALRERRYRPGLFKQHCGTSLDKLWREFLTESLASAH
jgi:hypothetical protein